MPISTQVKTVAGGFTFGRSTGSSAIIVSSSPKRRRSVGGGGGISPTSSTPTSTFSSSSSPILGGGSTSKSRVTKGTVFGVRRKATDLSPQPKNIRGKGRMSPSSRLSPASNCSSSSRPPSRSPSRNLTSSRGGPVSHYEKGSASPISSVRERATIDPFDGKGASLISSFANAYNNRDLPCRLMHGSVTHQLKWETDIEQLQYDPLVQIFAEGLVETRHPYHFVARKGLKELLNADGAGAKTTPIVQKLIAPIRATLISRDPDVYQGGIAALVDLSNAVGEALNPHIKLLLGQLAKNAMKPSFRDQVTDVLNVLETNGGKACYKMIKTKIPTYCTVNIGQLGINFNP